jgi:hypothetical protein
MEKNKFRDDNQLKVGSNLINPLKSKSPPLVKETKDNSIIVISRQIYIEVHNNISLQNILSFAVLSVFLLGSLSINAQRAPSPPPVTGTSRAASSSDARANRRTNTQEVEGAFEQLRAMEIPSSNETPNMRSLIEITRNIYRKPNKQEMKVLAPSSDHLNKYALFLRQPDTGIIKLNSDSNCAESPTVIVAKENCLTYSMPGAGTAYSFRSHSHRIPHLADLTLSKNVLKSHSLMQQGILVELGNIPLEDVTLQTRGLKYLIDFEALTEPEILVNFNRQLLEGVSADGFIYGLNSYASNQTTYALRSIAYKGKAPRAANGIAYNELDFDKRRDILVAFRIIEQEANGNITLVWKMLSNKDAPTLKIKQIKDNK